MSDLATNDKPRIRRALLGTVGNDTAQLAIADPMFLNPDITGDGNALIFESGYGDGTYPVYATYMYFGSGDERIAKIEIIMIDEKTLESPEIK